VNNFKIAVAVPTYNRFQLLRSLILSIPDAWSIFISDNDSSLLSGSCDFKSNVKISHADHLFSMFDNWNRALSLVDSDCTHVFITSDDDLYLPQAQIIIDNSLKKFPDVDVFVFGCDFIDENNRVRKGYKPTVLEVFEKGVGFNRFLRGVDARMPGILLRLDFLNKIGHFDTQLKITAADSELIQRALIMGKSVFIPESIALYRTWAGSATNATQTSDQWMQEIKLWTIKISNLLVKTGHKQGSSQKRLQKYRDEIFARNILSALGNLIAKEQYNDAQLFLSKYPIPSQARLLTSLRILRKRRLLMNKLP
jgi:hypothetical protein